MIKADDTKLFFIVEDNQIFSKTVVKGLEKEFPNSVTKAFATGEDMLQYLEDNPTESPTIYILDYYLNSVNPDAMDGGEVLAKLKKRYSGRLNEMRVIMLTSSTEIKQAVELLQKGASHYIVKDEVFLDTLKPTIRQILDYQAIISQKQKYAEKADFYKKQLIYAGVAIGVIVVIALLVIFLT